ncbi:UDP-N-acetylmuramate dehydrogenase [bacterium]|nr:UDP-N-acetylmuramate dehydrogenase [bacterium]
MLKYFRPNVLLSDLTTFAVGGPALWLSSPVSAQELKETLEFAKAENLPFYPVGAGSNILASDRGFKGIIIKYSAAEISFAEDGGNILATAQAGASWDALVQTTVERNLAGLECLSGIPGNVGAVPIQNVGAYGQEVSNTIESVEVFDTEKLETLHLPASACEFAYRNSRFKRDWRGRYIVASVTFRLHPHGAPNMRYQDIERFFSDKIRMNPQWRPNLSEVRQAVLKVRRSKSMLYDPDNPNHRCAGSFYLNPIVSRHIAEGLAREYSDMPIFPCEQKDKLKLSAAWLIEHAGFTKGYKFKRAGLSSDHVLALINTGRASAQEILELSEQIIAKVNSKFSISLVPEPNLLGF